MNNEKVVVLNFAHFRVDILSHFFHCPFCFMNYILLFRKLKDYIEIDYLVLFSREQWYLWSSSGNISIELCNFSILTISDLQSKLPSSLLEYSMNYVSACLMRNYTNSRNLACKALRVKVGFFLHCNDHIWPFHVWLIFSQKWP